MGALCLAGGLVLATTAGAGAAVLPGGQYGGPGHGGFPGGGQRGHWSRPVVGTVVTPPGTTAPTTFTMNVKGTGGTTTLVTVSVATTTNLREPGFSSVALANILAGDQVSVSGTQGGPTAVTATGVNLPEVWESGTVVTPPGTTAPTTFTMNVKQMGGTTTLVTVSVGTTTTLREPGFSSVALANILAGDQVSVAGTQGGPTAVTATGVSLPEVRDIGTVVTPPGTTAPTTFTMNVKQMGGTTTLVTVNVGTSTVLRQRGNSSPALSAIVANAVVSVTATQGTGGALNATEVTLAASGNGGQGGGYRHGHHHR